MRQQGLHIHWPCQFWHHVWNHQRQEREDFLFNYWWESKWSTLAAPPFTSWLLFQLQSGRESVPPPLANLPLCIIKHHMWSTAKSRIAFWYFLWPGLCTNVSAHYGDRNPTGGGAARRTVASVTRLQAGLWFQIPPCKESDGRAVSFCRHDMPRPSCSSTGVNYSASNITAYSTVARLSEF